MEWMRLPRYRGQYYSAFQFSIPIAIGATFKLVGPFDAAIEFGYRYLFTDYIDDVSNNYVGFDRFEDPLARIMSDRSAEPMAVVEGIQRANVRVTNTTMSDGNVYYGAGDIGGGLSDGAIRGNPKDNDMIFMTTLKIVYIFQGTPRAKFR